MTEAIKAFIAKRQAHSPNFVVKRIDNVKRIGGGLKNQCYQNSYSARQTAIRRQMVVMMSGWLVQPYNAKTKSTAIIQHWWNADSTGKHFDTSPLHGKEEVYVQDSSLYQFCIDNDSRLTTHVSKSLLYQDGKFSILVDEMKMEFMEVDELRTEYLYGLTS